MQLEGHQHGSQGAVACAARSAVTAADSVLLTGRGPGGTVLDNAHVVLDDGRIGLVVAPGTPLCGARRVRRDDPDGAGAPVALHVTDLVPVAARDRVRSRVTITGRLQPGEDAGLHSRDVQAVLHLLDGAEEMWVLTPEHVLVDRDDDLVMVSATDWANAQADPLAAREAGHVVHLATRHPEVLARMTTLLDPDLLATAQRVLPVGLDSTGFVLRVEQRDGHVDVRLSFAHPVVAPQGLRRAVDALLGRRPGACCDACREVAAGSEAASEDSQTFLR